MTWDRIEPRGNFVDSIEAAELIGTSLQNIRTLVKRGKLTRVGVWNKRAVFLRGEITNYAATRRVTSEHVTQAV